MKQRTSPSWKVRARQATILVLALTQGIPPAVAQAYRFRIPLIASKTGAAGGGQLNYSSERQDFGAVLLRSAATQLLTIQNVGTASVTLNKIESSGTPFTQTSDCEAYLAPSASCTVRVTFAPVQSGNSTGTLTVLSDDVVPTVTFDLTGRGQAGTLTAQNYTFPAPKQIGTPMEYADVAISNSSTAPVDISGVSVALGVEHFGQNNNCLGVLPPGASCIVRVSFVPNAVGALSGVVALTSDSDASPTTFQVFGEGRAPSANLSVETFSALQVGDSQDKLAQLTNTGVGPVDISSVTASGTDFVLVTGADTCPNQLSPAQSCALSVRFTPTAPGTRTGTLTLVTSAGNLSESLAGSGQAATGTLTALDFSSVPISTTVTRTATLKNTGIGNLQLGVPSVSGTGFTRDSSSCATTLAPGASCTVTIGFTPANAGQASGQISVSSNAGTLTASVTGIGVPGEATLSSSSVQFSAQTVGTSSTTQVTTVTNTGLAPLTLSGISVASGTSDFGQNNNCGTTLSAGASCSITVSFTPSTPGVRTGAIALAHDGTGASSIQLNGTGEAAASASASLNPATVTTGTSATLTWTTSSASSVTVSCTGAASYSYTGTNVNSSASVSTSVAGTGTCTVTPLNSLGIAGPAATATVSVITPPTGLSEYTTAGTYQWVVPANVYSVSVVAVGAGGGWSGTTLVKAGGGGGALGWKNNIPVTPGQVIPIVVGTTGGSSSFNTVYSAAGGTSASNNTAGQGGKLSASPSAFDGGGNGGNGSIGFWTEQIYHGGGGGAGGYSGNGGNGSYGAGAVGYPGAGGAGAGGGGAAIGYSWGGGGVGLYGQGSSGDRNGAAGSGGVPGTYGPAASAFGGAYGGGSGGGTATGGGGAVRVIWGPGKSFPLNAN